MSAPATCTQAERVACTRCTALAIQRGTLRAIACGRRVKANTRRTSHAGNTERLQTSTGSERWSDVSCDGYADAGIGPCSLHTPTAQPLLCERAVQSARASHAAEHCSSVTCAHHLCIPRSVAGEVQASQVDRKLQPRAAASARSSVPHPRGHAALGAVASAGTSSWIAASPFSMGVPSAPTHTPWPTNSYPVPAAIRTSQPAAPTPSQTRTEQLCERAHVAPSPFLQMLSVHIHVSWRV